MRVLFYSLLLLLFYSCNSNKLAPKDYVKWVENPANGLRVHYVSKFTTYTLQYRPIEYIAAIELKQNNISEHDLLKKQKELEGLQYYQLRITSNSPANDLLHLGISNEQVYYKRVNYYSYDFENDIYLLEGSDTLRPKLFNFVRNYNIAPYLDFVFAFEKSKDSLQDKNIFIGDKAFEMGFSLQIKSAAILNRKVMYCL